MNAEEALAEIFWVRDSELSEESPLDNEDVSEYSADSSKSEDEIETVEESEDVAVGDGNGKGQNLCGRNIGRAACSIGRGTRGRERCVFGAHGVARAKFVDVLILHSKQLLKQWVSVNSEPDDPAFTGSLGIKVQLPNNPSAEISTSTSNRRKSPANRPGGTGYSDPIKNK